MPVKSRGLYDVRMDAINNLDLCDLYCLLIIMLFRLSLVYRMLETYCPAKAAFITTSSFYLAINAPELHADTFLSMKHIHTLRLKYTKDRTMDCLTRVMLNFYSLHYICAHSFDS